MGSPPAGEADRSLRAPQGSVSTPRSVPAIVLLLLAGLALRLIIAYVIFPGSGFKTDLASFTSWALTLAGEGPGRYYATAGFADYTPGYLYVLWVIGAVGKGIATAIGGDPVSVIEALLKVPPILADLLVGYLLYRLVLRWNGRSATRAALLAAALFLFNPVTWYDSALWAQIDGVGSIAILVTLFLLVEGWSEGALAGAVVAGLVKPQFGLVLGPVVVVLLLRRHLFVPGSGPRPRLSSARLAAWFADEQGPWRLVSSAALALAVLLVVITPFSLDVPGLVWLVIRTAGQYHYLTVNAYNGWALLGQDSLAVAGTWTDDLLPLFGPIPGVVVGSALLLVGYVVGMLQAALRDGRRSILLALIFLSLAFFVLPTRVHERYLFPAFVFLPFLAIVSRRWLVATLVLMAVSLMNLHGVLTLPLYATPNIADLWPGPLFRSAPGVAIAAAGQIAVFTFVTLSLDPVRSLVARVRGRPAPDFAAEDAAWQPGPRAGGPYPTGPAELGAAAGAAAAVGATRPHASAAGPVSRDAPPGSGAAGAAWVGVAGPEGATTAVRPGDTAEVAPARTAAAATAVRRRRVGPSWLREIWIGRSVRADRSGSLTAEPGGRFDRMDVLVLVLVVLAALTLRAWRVGEPYGMYFDEVYHARTATEFLQDWRYGIPHDIYEFTHPHLAKYLMALGIETFGDNQVTGQSDLGVPVTSAAIERAWGPDPVTGRSGGDRVYVATGSEVRAFDPSGRGLVGTIAVPGATAVTVDPDAHILYIGTSDGSLWRIPTDRLDGLHPGGATPPLVAERLPGSGAGGSVSRIVAVPGGASILAATDDGRLVSVDPTTGAVLGRAAGSAPVTGLAALDPVDRVVVDMRKASEPATAQRLATALGDTSGRVERVLAGPARTAVVGAFLTSDQRSAVGALTDPGISIESGPIVAVSGGDRVRFLDAATLDEVATVITGTPTGGLVLTRGIDKPRLYVAAGNQLQIITVGTDAAPVASAPMPMPATVRDVAWDEATNLVHVLGVTPDGSSPTIYVVEPHANSVFEDARLPFQPSAWVVDQQPQQLSADRQQILAFSPTGSTVSVDVGRDPFGWRFPGVIAGALMLGFLYLLTRILFRRRSVAVIVALLGLCEGMFFANARIAMNDTYVGLFVVAAYAVFAALYLGRWRGWSAMVIGLPLVGLLLGLATASKWVGLYALGGIVLLVLLRSALGRLIALGAMVALSGFLGYLSLSHAAGLANPQTNPGFLALMVVLTFVLAVGIVVRPIRFTLEEVRFAVGAPLVAGILLGAAAVAGSSVLPRSGPTSSGTLLAAGFGMLVLSGVAYAAFAFGGRLGFGPLAPPPPPGDARRLLPPASDAPSQSWLVPGASLGIPWLWALACLALLPIAIYVLSYIPWVALGNQWFSGYPPGHTGQTLYDLQVSMYNYHNDLRATHPASSPWWAWPLDLKPVWFAQNSYAGDTGASIYDIGNLVVFWLGIPAAAWAAWQGWRRRSLALGLVVIALLCQYIPWLRIDRATFQYHYFTTLPFVVIALGYFVAELWHGPSRRTWALARIAAAVAIMGPAILWLLKGPLCLVAGTAAVSAGSQTCNTAAGSVVVSQRVVVAGLIVALGVLAMAWQAWPTARGGRNGERAALLAWAGAIAIATLFALTIVPDRFPDTAILSVPVGGYGSYAMALVVAALLAVPAWLALHARDPRRFAAGIVIAAAVWFVVFYPTIASLPLPGPVVSIYQGLLPTWIYDFQFAVNLDPAANMSVVSLGSLLLVAMIGLGALAVMYATWSWRQELASRRAARSAPGGASLPGSPLPEA